MTGKDSLQKFSNRKKLYKLLSFALLHNSAKDESPARPCGSSAGLFACSETVEGRIESPPAWPDSNNTASTTGETSTNASNADEKAEDSPGPTTVGKNACAIGVSHLSHLM